MVKTTPRLPLPLLALGAYALALLVLGAAAPGFVGFFPLLSLWAGLALFYAAVQGLKIAHVELDRFHWAVLGVLWLCAAIYLLFTLSRRDFIYYWDYSNYIFRQYKAEAAFAGGAGAGLRYLVGTFAEDYTSFISLFTEFPFCLTRRTGDAYTASQLVSILPTLLVALAGMVRKVGQCLDVQNERLFFVLGMGLCACFPFVRMAAMLGQPDWFGLIFALLILTLTLDYRFDRAEPVRWAMIFFATAALILTRRWYLYFAVGYYFCYAVMILADCVRRYRTGKKLSAVRRARNLVLFGAGSVVAMLMLLWPMVRHILTYSYASHYAYYNFGGLSLEVYQQLLHLGLFNLILVVVGLVFAWRRHTAFLPLLALCQVMCSMLLFTRVQNTGSHQTLQFVPGYLVLFAVGAAALTETLDRQKGLKLGFVACNLVLSMSVRCSPLTIVALPEPVLRFLSDKTSFTETFVRLDDAIYDRLDQPQIQALTSWVDQHCAPGETAYMIPHDMLYNPDIFQNCALPQVQLADKLCFGFSILGTHNFPTGYLDSKYVITADPFPQTYVSEGELSAKLNQCFLEERDQYFAYETQFDMGNGTQFTVWRRVRPADRTEAESLLRAFAAEDAQFPEMFSGVIQNWLTQRGL